MSCAYLSLRTLLEHRDIPFRKVGAHRRILLEDLMRYKQRIDTDRRGVVHQLKEDAQDLNRGF